MAGKGEINQHLAPVMKIDRRKVSVIVAREGEEIEGKSLDDVTVIGVVTFTICDVRQDNSVV